MTGFNHDHSSSIYQLFLLVNTNASKGCQILQFNKIKNIHEYIICLPSQVHFLLINNMQHMTPCVINFIWHSMIAQEAHNIGIKILIQNKFKQQSDCNIIHAIYESAAISRSLVHCIEP